MSKNIKNNMFFFKKAVDSSYLCRDQQWPPPSSSSSYLAGCQCWILLQLLLHEVHGGNRQLAGMTTPFLPLSYGSSSSSAVWLSVLNSSPISSLCGSKWQQTAWWDDCRHCQKALAQMMKTTFSKQRFFMVKYCQNKLKFHLVVEKERGNT